MATLSGIAFQTLRVPSASPLATATDANRRDLCKVLWEWDVCGGCKSAKECAGVTCPSTRLPSLRRYFEHYKQLVSSYSHDLECQRTDATVNSHEEIFGIIRVLKQQPNITRRNLADETFGRERVNAAIDADREHVIGLAVKAFTMVYCTHWLNQNAEHDNGDLESPSWLEDVPFNIFLEEMFPMIDHPGFGEDSSSSFWELKSSITGTKLVRRGGLKFEPTEDLSNHLKLNRKTGVVEIFHHTAFLKENLRITKGASGPMSIAEALGLGVLPRQLALEVLDSLQKIIFPLSDPSAVSLLQSLVNDKDFDQDCLRFEASAIREPHEINTRYLYFGARLADIHDEMENPTPRGFISRWAKRKGAGHANVAAIFAVVLALLFGLITLGLGGFQAWVSWQQWKHPI
ncbi:hypothetical protein H072_6227 [Dactylellina haptotyla CBS 200.50]|uniref:Uncharacterized protein n=1 Tax=Dactylellina haptotyla (strain CBS 200.50) TaxID=1284197 RepID=S8AAB5_DACHA|nr:hypothetical protein H072_6227 [Dactylellina haptotyla CBS 200.50]